VGDQLASAQSTLVLNVPADVWASVAEATLKNIYVDTAATPVCLNGSATPLDIVLAQACLTFQSFYLTPDLLPSSLDALDTAEQYVEALGDDFSLYISPASFQDLVQPQLEGARAFMGVALEIDGPASTIGPGSPLTITEVAPLTRAWYDGLLAGDKLIEVDGQPLADLTLDEALELLPRTEAATATLTVQRGAGTLTIATAAEQHISFFVDGEIAYLNVRSYTNTTGRQVREDFEEMVQAAASPIDKVILDLRNNGGGSVQGALELTDYLIDHDQPPQTSLIMSFEDALSTKDDKYLGDYPTSDDLQDTQNLADSAYVELAILVDSASASASEITISALKHYRTATVFGAQTFGKGVRQDVAELVDGSGLFITSQRILDPAGNSYHGVGLEPDILVAGTATPEQDPQLEAAIDWLTDGTLPVAAAGGVWQSDRSNRTARDPWSSSLSRPIQ
jgi:carboxyl-terminal processing protease